MSTLSEAFITLKNTMLLQERVDGLRGDMIRNADDLRALTEKVVSLDKRVVRIETLIEMSMRREIASRGEGT